MRHYAVVKGDRAETFQTVFGTNRVRVTSPNPIEAELPGIPEPEPVYFLDLASLTLPQRESLITHLSKVWGRRWEETEADLRAYGMPIRAFDVTIESEPIPLPSVDEFAAAFLPFLGRPPITVELAPLDAWALLVQIQLACRHPNNASILRDQAETFARALQSAVQLDGVLADVAEAGWDPTYDGELPGVTTDVTAEATS